MLRSNHCEASDLDSAIRSFSGEKANAAASGLAYAWPATLLRARPRGLKLTGTEASAFLTGAGHGISVGSHVWTATSLDEMQDTAGAAGAVGEAAAPAAGVAAGGLAGAAGAGVAAAPGAAQKVGSALSTAGSAASTAASAGASGASTAASAASGAASASGKVLSAAQGEAGDDAEAVADAQLEARSKLKKEQKAAVKKAKEDMQHAKEELEKETADKEKKMEEAVGKGVEEESATLDNLQCFSGDSTVYVYNRGVSTPLRSLQIGDRVLCGRSEDGQLHFSAFLGFLHAEDEAEGDFLRITVQDVMSRRTLLVTREHLVFVVRTSQSSTASLTVQACCATEGLCLFNVFGEKQRKLPPPPPRPL
eukprot:TRINITY_DN20243_c0_g1_i3.p1 TRINITY_DN20243_c0_g1~~TRINITY_DN20243_c0_g1_i3.p1  ORF type:complete len:365 (-),score=73.40 TRINITY_DN20243_c0_g1_i3:26-1120(-)